MGSVETLYDDDGKVRGYQARWRERSGRAKKKNFLKKDGLIKDDAKNHVVKMERDKVRRVNTAIDEKVTIATLVDEYIDLCIEEGRAEQTISAIRTRARHIQDAPLGKMAAVDMRWSDGKRWAAKLRQTHSENTAKGALSLLTGAFQVALRDGRVSDASATKGIPIRREGEREEVVPLEVAQVADLLSHMEPRRRIIAMVQAHTGVRIQEALGLLRSEVDLDGQVILVRMQLHRDRRERIPLKGIVKSKHVRRDIPIGNVLATALREWFDEHPRGLDTYAFVDAAGDPWVYNTYLRHIKGAGAAVGLQVATHDLRHHHASVLIAANVQMLVIARRLGHSSITQIEQTYGHLLRSTDLMTRGAVDSAWEGH